MCSYINKKIKWYFTWLTNYKYFASHAEPSMQQGSGDGDYQNWMRILNE